MRTKEIQNFELLVHQVNQKFEEESSFLRETVQELSERLRIVELLSKHKSNRLIIF